VYEPRKPNGAAVKHRVNLGQEFVNRSCDDGYRELTERDNRVHEKEAFRRGYDRGLQYLEAFRKHAKS
jgi:hypothetical protein